MNDRHPCDRSVSSLTTLNPVKITAKHVVAIAAVFLATLACSAQQSSQADEQSNQSPRKSQPESSNATVTIPAGTNIALVLTNPIQTRYIHHGDDIYAQITSPVNSGDQTVIPPGTFVQGKVDKLIRNGGRGEVRLQSMSITFPDGYVVPIPGPVTLISDDGWALKDPGSGRIVATFALPAAGAGLGALIGHSLGHSQSTTFPGLPPNCGVPTPGCTNGTPGTTLTDNSSRLKSTAIGSMAGLAIGGVAAVAVLFGSHNFYLDVGSPVEMTLPQPVTLQQGEAEEAVQQAEQHPTPVQPVAPRPVPPPPPPGAPVDHGTCWTPGTPGTPPTVIPGPPGPDGIPGPPTIIPGTPQTPGTPYPCP
jgi:hypothetical protein